MTARLRCGGKEVRRWSHGDIAGGPIELSFRESCSLDWTLTASGPPREVRFVVETARVFRPMALTVGQSNSPMRLSWVFSVGGR